jgi:hypothetical protein
LRRLLLTPDVSHDHRPVLADLICARWLSPIRVRSAKPNAALSHATACRTSG